MKFSKRILKNRFAQALICRLLYAYIRFTYLTTRWIVIGRERLDGLLAMKTPVIMVFWHGRVAMVANTWPKHFPKMNLLISRHRDGEIIATTMTHFGFGLIRGSTGKEGAMSSIRESLRKLGSGEALGMTPDGPRGPRMRVVTTGVIDIARKSGATMLPITFATEHAKIFRSWDRFMLSLPFGRGTVIYGDALTIPRDATREQVAQCQKQLEAELNRITRQADEAMGISPVTPTDVT